MRKLPSPSELSVHWQLDPSIVFLNHGSFGATPTRVLAYQRALQDRMEKEPVRFYVEAYNDLLDEARREVRTVHFSLCVVYPSYMCVYVYSVLLL